MTDSAQQSSRAAFGSLMAGSWILWAFITLGVPALTMTQSDWVGWSFLGLLLVGLSFCVRGVWLTLGGTTRALMLVVALIAADLAALRSGVPGLIVAGFTATAVAFMMCLSVSASRWQGHSNRPGF
jgi:hypothetical protein